MKLETLANIKEGSSFNFFFFFSSLWSPIISPRGEGQPRIRQAGEEAQSVYSSPGAQNSW